MHRGAERAVGGHDGRGLVAALIAPCLRAGRRRHAIGGRFALAFAHMSTERLLARGELVGGRFTIERPFAAGGMGRIYRAVDALGGAHVALKVMTSDDGDNDLPRFAREASVTFRSKVARSSLPR